jgi:riboflavin kinase / FMN adenylyltransferase
VKIHTGTHTFRATHPVVTVGTFDGVHLGHRMILERLNRIASEKGGESVLLTFSPHPRLVLYPREKNLRLLTTLDEKKELLASLNVNHLIIYPFTREFSKLSYPEFVKKILVDTLHTRYLVVGYDHRFGKNREGGFPYLNQCAGQYGFDIEKLDPLLINLRNISSSAIRQFLEEGNITQANQYLGYRFTLHGKIVEGEKRGRKIGFPTANIEASDIYKLIPGYGVYAVRIRMENSEFNGMLNIGTRPTFNKNADKRSIEVHIFDFNENIYGKSISLQFEKRIREERKFNHPQELVNQLVKDREQALAYLTGGD